MVQSKFQHSRQLKPMYDALAGYSDKIPEAYIQSLSNFIIYGIEPGSFHTALLANDVRSAARSTDSFNQWSWIVSFIKFMEQHAPPDCWGSIENIKEWKRLSHAERFEINHRYKLVLTEKEATWSVLENSK